MPAEILHLVDADLVVVALQSALKRRDTVMHIQDLRKPPVATSIAPVGEVLYAEVV
jgi:hypothetical protein